MLSEIFKKCIIVIKEKNLEFEHERGDGNFY